MLRLLEQGHFKGVADVRLRINFAGELAQRQTQALQQAGDEQLASLTDSITAPLASLTESSELQAGQQQDVTDSQDALVSAIDAVHQSLGESDNSDRDAIVTDVQAAFDQLVVDLSAALAHQGNRKLSAMLHQRIQRNPLTLRLLI